MKINYPTLVLLGQSALETLKRFPFVLFSALLGTGAVVWLINQEGATSILEGQVIALCFVGFLGISLSYATTIIGEEFLKSEIQKIALNSAIIIFLAGYYLYLDTYLMDASNDAWYQLFLFFLASHLLAAFAPFLKTGSIDQFWEYNKSLFFRILISVVYSGALFVGLSVAVLALDVLLEFDIDDEFYLTLFVMIGGIFNTWFFLSGIPNNEDISENEIDYPKGLKVFVQYVLIPLVTVYIVILYAYLGKIIIEWELPTGWVANLVLSFSIAGILSLLLLYPLRDKEENAWINLYSTWYYRALIPLVLLLFVSIWVRISEYGVTINRFFVATLGVWLTGMVVYFIVSKVKSIKVIPISLTVMVLISAIGPFSAFSVSERSQLGRILEFTNSEDKLLPKSEIEAMNLTDDQITQINSAVFYLIDNHGEEVFERIMDDERAMLIADSTRNGISSNAEFIVEELIGVTYRNTRYGAIEEDIQNYSYRLETNSPLIIEGYTTFLGTFNFYSSDIVYPFSIGDNEYTIGFDQIELELELSGNTGEIEVPLTDLILSLHESNNYEWFSKEWAAEDLEIEVNSEVINAKLLITNVNGSTGEEEMIQSITVHLFVK